VKRKRRSPYRREPGKGRVRAESVFGAPGNGIKLRRRVENPVFLRLTKADKNG
jgi:hypothetical protein